MRRSGDYLDRLAAMNRAPLEYVPEDAPDEPTLKSLAHVVDGLEIRRQPWGSALVVSTPAGHLSPEAPSIVREFGSVCRAEEGAFSAFVATLCGASLSLDDFAFLDIETTGLGATPLFLIGMMTGVDGELVVRQYLARDYSEEAAVIALCAEEVAEKALLVTFNGKSFDVPYIESRAASTGAPWALRVPHIDLLHESRRVWRGMTPNHKLQTLEQMICGRLRDDDIPGSQVPEAYNAFIRTGDATDLARILEHNRLDLLTLVDLINRIPEQHWRPPAG